MLGRARAEQAAEPKPTSFWAKNAKSLFPKKIFFWIWLPMLLNGGLHILCKSVLSGPDTKQDEMETQNQKKKWKKISKKKPKNIFEVFFFIVCPGYYLAIQKKWNWENEKPVFFGAPLGRTRSLFRLRAAPLGEKARSCCRWHSLAGALCRRRFVFLFFLFPLFFSLSSLLFFFPLFFFSFLPFLFPFLLFLSFPSLLFLFSSSPPSFSLFFSLSFPAVSLPSCLVQGLGLRVWGCML